MFPIQADLDIALLSPLLSAVALERDSDRRVDAWADARLEQVLSSCFEAAAGSKGGGGGGARRGSVQKRFEGGGDNPTPAPRCTESGGGGAGRMVDGLGLGEGAAYAQFYGSVRCSGPSPPEGECSVANEMRRIDMDDKGAVRGAIQVGEPFVLTGLCIGDCLGKWTPEYLHDKAGNTQLAAGVHVCPRDKTVDLAGHRRAGTAKNFHFVEMSFGEFIHRCAPEAFPQLEPLRPVAEEAERLYLRSVAMGGDAGRKASHVHDVFPGLAPDLILPHGVVYDREQYHSSVLRVASADTELWTHFDVMHNMLIQIQGSKRVTLWPPSEDGNLYTEGSSSRVASVDAPDLTRHPRFARTHASRVAALLRPGEAVFIPPLWFHHVSMPDFSVAVNVFWRGHDERLYNAKDIYGNKDLPVADTAMAAASKIGKQLKTLPEPFRTFYARRAAAELLACAGACGPEEMTLAYQHVPAAPSSKRLLHGRVCVVTGATGGIGMAVCVALASRGASVVMVSRQLSRARRLAAAVRSISKNHQVWAYQADVCVSSSLRGMASQLALQFGAVHVLVNCAVSAPARRQLVETSVGLVEEQWAVNVLGYHLVLHHLLDLLHSAAAQRGVQEEGDKAARVLNLASEFASKPRVEDLEFKDRPYSAVSAYKQAKGANRMLSWAWARRLRDANIHVNAIHPGAVMGTKLAHALALQRGTHTAEQAADAVAAAAAGDDPSLNISGAFLVPPVSGPCKIADCEFQRDETACDELLAIVEERYCRAA